MEEIIIDLLELSKEYGVEINSFVAPDGRTVHHPHWDRSIFERFLPTLEARKKDPDKKYAITNCPEPWITAASIKIMEPLDCDYLYPSPDMFRVNIKNLKRGEPNLTMSYELIEEGDKLFVNLSPISEKDAARGEAHDFDLTNLHDILIPEIPGGKDVFVHGWGMYAIMVCVAYSYFAESKSVSLSCHETPYYCCYTTTDERKLGDAEQRSVPNNLPHPTMPPRP